MMALMKKWFSLDVDIKQGVIPISKAANNEAALIKRSLVPSSRYDVHGETDRGSATSQLPVPVTTREWASCWVFRTRLEERASTFDRYQPVLAASLKRFLAVRCVGCGAPASGEGAHIELCDRCQYRRQWPRN